MTAIEIESFTVTRYRCPFCEESGADRKAVTNHAVTCPFNPAVRTCLTCVHDASSQPICDAGVNRVIDGMNGICGYCPQWEPKTQDRKDVA